MIDRLQFRALMFCLVLVAGFSVLSLRLIDIQFFQSQKEVVKQKDLHVRKIPLVAQRGYLCDRNQEVMARNTPVTSIVANKQHMGDCKVVAVGVACQYAARSPDWGELDEEERRKRIKKIRYKLLRERSPKELVDRHLAYLVAAISSHLQVNKEQLREKLGKLGSGEVVLVKELPEDVADRLEAVVKEYRLRGLTFRKSYRRYYPAPELAVHTTGYVNHKNEGQAGIERSMEKYLQGQDGYLLQKQDLTGQLLAINDEEVNPPKAGLNVQLTIDLGLQAIVEEELSIAMKEAKAQRGAIILLEPESGEILAMANRPHFNLNIKKKVNSASLDFATQGIYEPGSTFKVVAVSSALNANLVNLKTSIFCHKGSLQEDTFVVPDHHPYGYLTVESVLWKSSNIGTYKLAKQVGINRFFNMVSRYGFGKRTGVSLPGEQAGFVNNQGNPVDFSRVTYGYAVSVTPLQMALAYGVLANGGWLMKPQIVKSLIANDGRYVEVYSPKKVIRVLKPRTALHMRRALAGVVKEKGTAIKAAVPGYQVAGKTGTARKHHEGGKGYLDGRYTVSFSGMLPVEKPEFVCVVVLDDPLVPKKMRYGGTLAAPVFSKVARRAANYMNIRPTEAVNEIPIAAR